MPGRRGGLDALAVTVATVDCGMKDKKWLHSCFTFESRVGRDKSRASGNGVERTRGGIKLTRLSSNNVYACPCRVHLSAAGLTGYT
jgi:hypothetical protein